ncbi:CAF17-like 4Fe-4S cluster assembly/insertion protein YgfZ [Methylophilus aquaticus]|uniref:Folate-binding protein n=1 Tax=Methylophilus aquaticus TaxID=1971610 RepID=A0ABT9JUZ1_9PROT|nr:folate-binding protein [Methylophilus aquaticus]MDP8568407.1 folate-binding protein [Methylophilus aquaticus]
MSSVAWQQFLTTQGARIDAQHYAHFNPSTAENRLFDLSALGLIAVRGEDAQTFLQGQLTNDIKQTNTGAQLTGYCTAKGRLLALFYAWQTEDTVTLQCPRAMVPDLVKRLRMFVLRSKVVIEDVSDQFVCMGLAGPALQSLTPGIPETVHGVSHNQQVTLIRLPKSGGLPRAQAILPVAIAETHWRQFANLYTPSSTDAWDALEIQAGIPQVYPQTKEQFVPQMLNLDALGGINFKKGCYTGQEIVARTHYLGKVKRRTLVAQLSASNSTPQAGDTLLDAQQQEAGQLVRVAPDVKGGWSVLAECRLESKEAGVVTWQGQALTFVAPPYALT